MDESSKDSKSPNGWSVEGAVFAVVFLSVAGLTTAVACGPPGPAGYNIITGEGMFFGQGRFGLTYENVVAGLVYGAAAGLAVGGCCAVVVSMVRTATANLMRWWSRD